MTMCQNAEKNAAELLAAIKPTITEVLTLAGVANTPQAAAALEAYDEAETDLANWQKGTPATEAIEAITDLQTAINALPIPTQYQALINIILAGLETVIGVVTANSPAPAPAADATVAPEDAQDTHMATVAAATADKVHTLIPGIKLTRNHPAAAQYTTAWASGMAAVKTAV
jgi:hypothetical protein